MPTRNMKLARGLACYPLRGRPERRSPTRARNPRFLCLRIFRTISGRSSFCCRKYLGSVPSRDCGSVIFSRLAATKRHFAIAAKGDRRPLQNPAVYFLVFFGADFLFFDLFF